jgi:hypothetical protein
VARAKVRLTRPGRTYAVGQIQANGIVLLNTLRSLITPRNYTLTVTYRNTDTHYTVRVR